MKKILKLSARMNEERKNYFRSGKSGPSPLAILSQSFCNQIQKFQFSLVIDSGHTAEFASCIECHLMEGKNAVPFSMVLLDDHEKNGLLLGREICIDDIILCMNDHLN